MKLFEDHLHNVASQLKDNFSHSIFETETSCANSSSEFTTLSWVDDFVKEARRRMDKKIAQIQDSFLVPLHIEGRSEVKCTKASSTETFLHPNVTPHPNPLHKKVLSLSEFEITSFASPKSPHEETSFASIEETSYSSIDSSAALDCSLEESIRPSNSKISLSVQPETSSRKVDLSNFITPEKVSFKEDFASRVIEDPPPRIIMPSSCEPSSTH